MRLEALAPAVDVPGWYPEYDSGSTHSIADVAASEQVFEELRAAYAAHVKQVRKKLRLTQEGAGVLIGGGTRACRKYERGEIAFSDAIVGLIEILNRHSEELDLLGAIRLAA